MQQQPHVGNSLKRLQAQGRIVVMSGDGINDAAAFGSGTRGNRHGTATDIAIDASA